MKVYYSIAEVRKITGLPASTLRCWEEQFAQLKPHKNDKGTRFYTEQDIELIKQIKYLRDELHITRIEAIRTELMQDSKKVEVRQRATEILQRVREHLVELRSML
jgi:DNA-binding transcriptional MerR regulator